VEVVSRTHGIFSLVTEMIKYMDGDILDCKEDVIVQSVNHQGVMGGGLALQIKNKYPEIMDKYGEYKTFCETTKFENIRANGSVAWYHAKDGKRIASIFGQDEYGRRKRYTDYVSFGNGLYSVKNMAMWMEYSLAIPYGIGCGLGGGDWNIILDIIQTTFSFSPEVEVFIYMRNK